MLLWNMKIQIGPKCYKNTFVPIDAFTEYIDDLRNVLNEDEFNLLNITIRYVKRMKMQFCPMRKMICLRWFF